jgi:hypothetical protein
MYPYYYGGVSPFRTSLGLFILGAVLLILFVLIRPYAEPGVAMYWFAAKSLLAAIAMLVGLHGMWKHRSRGGGKWHKPDMYGGHL